MFEIAEHTSINQETIRLILHKELGMRKIYTKVAPEVLSLDQKQMRLELSQDWLTADAESGILNRVVTGDTSWINNNDSCNQL